jgi:hypothetical protein
MKVVRAKPVCDGIHKLGLRFLHDERYGDDSIDHHRPHEHRGPGAHDAKVLL